MTGTPDDMTARSFPAFPPQRRTKRFARSWWGNSWIQAMTDTALDQEQLKQGRKYACTGQVGAITVTSGRIVAHVHDGIDDTTYRCQVSLRQLDGTEWDRFLAQVCRRPGHVAALLDRAAWNDDDMPRDLAEAAEDAGIALLPDIGDLDPECECPGWELPCKHAAALSYQVAWLLDSDPFVLLLMRGRGEGELRDELYRRGSGTDTGADEPGGTSADEPVGLPAWQVYANEPAELPEPPTWTTAEAPELVLADESAVDAGALRGLITDAAGRAAELLAGCPTRRPTA